MKRKLKLNIGSPVTLPVETSVIKPTSFTIDNLNVHVEKSVRDRLESLLITSPKEAEQLIKILNVTRGDGLHQVLLKLSGLEVDNDTSE